MTDLSWTASFFASTVLSTVVAVTLGIAADLSYRLSTSELPSRTESLEASRRSLQVAKDCAMMSGEIEAKVAGIVDPDVTDSDLAPEGQVLDNGL